MISNVSFYLLTFSLTLWSTVLLQKLTGFQLIKKFPAFHGSRRFIAAFTSACHLSRPWASSIQFIPPHPTSWRFILILSSHLGLGLPSGLLLSGFPNQHPVYYTPIYAWVSPVVSFPQVSPTNTLYTILPSTLGSPQWSLSLRFPHPTPCILSSHLRLGHPSGLLPSGFPNQHSVHASTLPHTRYMPHPSHSSRFYHPNNTGWGVPIVKLLVITHILPMTYHQNDTRFV